MIPRLYVSKEQSLWKGEINKKGLKEHTRGNRCVGRAACIDFAIRNCRQLCAWLLSQPWAEVQLWHNKAQINKQIKAAENLWHYLSHESLTLRRGFCKMDSIPSPALCFWDKNSPLIWNAYRVSWRRTFYIECREKSDCQRETGEEMGELRGFLPDSETASN